VWKVHAFILVDKIIQIPAHQGFKKKSFFHYGNAIKNSISAMVLTLPTILYIMILKGGCRLKGEL
jgi:hypothetical protein